MKQLSVPVTGVMWFLAVLVGLFLIAWAALAILFPPERVRQMVEARLEAALAREVRFDKASLSIFPPVRVTVERIALAEPGGFDEGKALAVRSVHLDLDVFALFGKRIVVRRLVLDQPVIHVEVRPNGATNLDGIGVPAGARGAAADSARAGLPMEFAVSELTVRGGRVLHDDLVAERRTALAVDSRLALSLDREGRLRVSGETALSDIAFMNLGEGADERLNTSLSAIRWTLEHRAAFDPTKNRIAFERLALKFGRTAMAFQGIVDEPGAGARIDLRAQGENLDIGEVLGVLATADARALSGLSGSGQASFDVGMRGALGPGKLPAMDGSLTVSRGAFRYAGAPAGVEDLSFTALLRPDSIQIPRLSARMVADRASEPVTATLLVTRLSAPQVQFTVTGDLDLAAVAPLLAPEKTRLSGRAEVHVRGAGEVADPSAMRVQGTARLTGVRIETPELEQPIERVSGEIAFSNQRAEVRGLHASAGASSFTMDATIDRPLALMLDSLTAKEPVEPADVRFTLTSPQLDLGELLPPTPGAGVLPNARGSGEVRISRLMHGRLDVRDVDARVALEPGVVEVTRFSFAGYGGSVDGRGRFDLRGKEPVFAVNSNVRDVEANTLLSAWTPARDVLRGRLNTSIELSGESAKPEVLVRTLTAVGLADIRSGTIGPAPFLEAIASFTKIPDFREFQIRDGSMPFAVEDGRVSFREMRLTGGAGEWWVAGSVGFDGTLDYAVSMTIPETIAARLGTAGALAAGALRDTEGRILIDLRVQGPAKSPRVSWDKNAMLDRLMGRQSGAITRKGEKLGEKALEALEGRGAGTPDTSLADYEKRVRAAADSLKKLKLKDVMKGLFGGSKDTVW